MSGHREYHENQLRNLSKLVHEMATMVKVPLSQVTVLGILDPNTLIDKKLQLTHNSKIQ